MTPEQKQIYEAKEANDKNRYQIEIGFFSESTSRLGLSSSLSWIFPCTGRRRCEDSQWCMDPPLDDVPEEERIVATVGLPKLALTSGKWFYEIEVTEAGHQPRFPAPALALAFGWARRGWEHLQPDGGGRYGCGEDRFSYAYAGFGGFYLHESQEWAEESPMSVGDTVGCMLDLDGREIRFSVNGECNGFVFRSISVDSAYYPAMSMQAGVVDVNFGERALKFLPEGYTPVVEEQKKQMRAQKKQMCAEIEAMDTEIEALDTQPHRGAEANDETLLGRKAKYDAATAASEASMKIIEDRIDDLGTILRNPDPSGALYVLGLLDKLDEAARGAGEAAAPSHQDASGSTGWRHASVEDYGRAMRIALEELTASDGDEYERGRREQDELLLELGRLRQEHDKRTLDFHLENGF